MSPTGSRSAPGRAGGGTSAVVLAVLVVTVTCALGGFYIGRYVLGEQYLKMGAARIQQRPAPYVPPSRPVAPPVVEEPESVIEPAEQAPLPQRPEPEATAPPTAERDTTVTLQLGAFLKVENARALVRDLRNRGYSPAVVVEKQGQSTVHRVQMGPLSPERAQALASDLRRQGYEVGVLENR